MPRVVRFFVKTSLIYLALTFVLGAAFTAHRIWTGRDIGRGLLLMHVHLGTVGWLAFLVMGVALWMFPLHHGHYPEEKGRYHRAVAWVTYWLLNTGVLLRILAEPWFWGGGGSPWAGGLLVLSALAQVAAVGLFIATIWVRVKAIGGQA